MIRVLREYPVRDDNRAKYLFDPKSLQFITRFNDLIQRFVALTLVWVRETEGLDIRIDEGPTERESKTKITHLD